LSFLLYRYYSHYDFDTAAQKVFRQENTENGNKGTMPERTDALRATELNATVKDKGIYIDDTLLISLDSEESVGGVTAREYKTGSTSLIFLSVRVGNAPAPYTTYKEYFFKKDSFGIKQLPWDDKNNFGSIYPNGNDSFYIATMGYTPAYSSRWGNSFSDIYRYTDGADTFECITEKYSDTLNSMYAIGTEGDKLYFLGMWYEGEKDRYLDRGISMFSAVNGGYYTLDMKTGEITKLYPYISGEIFFGPDGNLYCISNSSRIPKIVNLNTGKLIPIE
jgi:hypothetical protein